MQIHGQTVDAQTRCVHYRSAADIVAIKFFCCGRFYPCHQCHSAGETHAARLWPANRWTEHAILCGACRGTLSIADYRAATACPSCGAAFNDGCRAHAHLYFDLPATPA
ncbi:MAG TPA: CHY zinc finger protein [Cryobacterium sp.]|nr:CHY zinc finger protein [Cryobacterium sp.]